MVLLLFSCRWSPFWKVWPLPRPFVSNNDYLRLLFIRNVTSNFTFFAAKGKTLDATQEMLALGACNILGSCFKSMPVTGSFTRTAVNNASGVRTTLGGTVTGVMVLLALAFLTGTFYYIPKASLAAIIICAMMYLFDYEAIIVLWKTKSK